MAAPASGDTIYRGASAWQRLAKGTDGHVLTLASGYPSWAAEAGSSADFAAIRDQIQYLLFRDDQAVGLNGLIYDGFTSDTLATKTNATWNSGGYYANTATAGSYSTEFTNTLSADNNGWVSYSMRQVVPASALSVSGGFIKLTLRSSAAGGGFKCDHVSIVEQSSTYVGTTTPTEIKFGGASGCNIAANTTATSDATAFSLDETKSYLVIIDVSSDGANDDTKSNNAMTGWTLYSLASKASWNEANPSGSWVTGASVCVAVEKIEVAPATPNNMTLIPSTATATSTPSKARISAFVVPVDSITLNTDLLAYATANNGSNWDQITLSLVASLASSVKQYTGEVTLTSPSTTMAWKLVSANNKSIQVTGCGLAWY